MFHCNRRSHCRSHNLIVTAICNCAYMHRHIYDSCTENMQLLSYNKIILGGDLGRTHCSATGASHEDMVAFRSQWS